MSKLQDLINAVRSGGAPRSSLKPYVGTGQLKPFASGIGADRRANFAGRNTQGSDFNSLAQAMGAQSTDKDWSEFQRLSLLEPKAVLDEAEGGNKVAKNMLEGLERRIRPEKEGPIKGFANDLTSLSLDNPLLSGTPSGISGRELELGRDIAFDASSKLQAAVPRELAQNVGYAPAAVAGGGLLGAFGGPVGAGIGASGAASGAPGLTGNVTAPLGEAGTWGTLGAYGEAPLGAASTTYGAPAATVGPTVGNAAALAPYGAPAAATGPAVTGAVTRPELGIAAAATEAGKVGAGAAAGKMSLGNIAALGSLGLGAYSMFANNEAQQDAQAAAIKANEANTRNSSINNLISAAGGGGVVSTPSMSPVPAVNRAGSAAIGANALDQYSGYLTRQDQSNSLNAYRDSQIRANESLANRRDTATLADIHAATYGEELTPYQAQALELRRREMDRKVIDDYAQAEYDNDPETMRRLREQHPELFGDSSLSIGGVGLTPAL